jgi:hypothetical protein
MQRQTGPGSSDYPPKHPFQGAALMGGAESISQRESEQTALKPLDAHAVRCQFTQIRVAATSVYRRQ